MAATRLPLTRLTPDAPDRELLERYVRERDERAFAALVARHGRMVKAVCRRVLGNDADADDATQAALLVFARKAAGIRDRNGLANWLFGVAHRVAAKARQTRTRRLAKEKQAPPRPPQQVATDFADLLQVELAKLPAAYRAAVLLCDLEGHTVADAAKHLGIPAGTVASRLARGRTRLADRLRSLGLRLNLGRGAVRPRPAGPHSFPRGASHANCVHPPPAGTALGGGRRRVARAGRGGRRAVPDP
jgi:RNA polymerase sigma factor (sigma-70 family)